MKSIKVLSIAAALLVGSGATVAQAEWEGGDAAAGATAYRACQACHTLDGNPRAGPSLAGLWGRPAGTADNFPRYSEPMKASGIIWDPAILFDYLADPRGMVPQSTMAYPGMPAEADRRNLIAYLIEEIGSP